MIEKAPDVEQFRDEYPNIGIDRAKQRDAYEKWIATAEKYIKKLEHYRDTTVGLYATDKPHLINDPKNLLFKITE